MVVAVDAAAVFRVLRIIMSAVPCDDLYFIFYHLVICHYVAVGIKKQLGGIQLEFGGGVDFHIDIDLSNTLPLSNPWYC